MSDIERNQFGDERSLPRRSQPGPGGQSGHERVGNSSEREFDALLNAALDAEAVGDIALAQESWAKIAAMDEARRRSAALLASGLAQLKQGNQNQIDVSANVLARLNLNKSTISTMPDAVTAETAPAREVSGTAQAMEHLVGEGRREARRDAALTDERSGHVRHTNDALAMERAADAVISTGRPWGLPSQRASQHRKRRWYRVSPMLASFVLGGVVTIGLVMIKHWSEGPASVAAPIASAASAPVAVPSHMVPQLVPQGGPPQAHAAAALRPALQMGDTGRYTRLEGLAPGWRMSQSPTNRWWDADRPDGPVLSMDAPSPFAKAVRPLGTLPEGVPSAATSGNTLWFNMLEDDDVLIVDAKPLVKIRPATPRKPSVRDVPPR